jgi:hypothetical protein
MESNTLKAICYPLYGNGAYGTVSKATGSVSDAKIVLKVAQIRSNLDSWTI